MTEKNKLLETPLRTSVFKSVLFTKETRLHFIAFENGHFNQYEAGKAIHSKTDVTGDKSFENATPDIILNALNNCENYFLTAEDFSHHIDFITGKVYERANMPDDLNLLKQLSTDDPKLDPIYDTAIFFKDAQKILKEEQRAEVIRKAGSGLKEPLPIKRLHLNKPPKR